MNYAGPALPPGWEMKMEPDGRMLYIDHNTKVGLLLCLLVVVVVVAVAAADEGDDGCLYCCSRKRALRSPSRLSYDSYYVLCPWSS